MLKKWNPLHRRDKGAEEPLFSILILSIPSRVEHFLVPLLASLQEQIQSPQEVEVLTLIDNKSLSIGEKRNKLRSISRGRYSAFVDDDDRVEDDYVPSIIAAIRSEPDQDVFCFDVWVNGYDKLGYTPPGGMLCKYGIEYRHENLPTLFTRKPNHLMVYKNDLAKSVLFPSLNRNEDDAWGKVISKKIKKQGRIDKVLYYYDFDVQTSENPFAIEWREKHL